MNGVRKAAKKPTRGIRFRAKKISIATSAMPIHVAIAPEKRVQPSVIQLAPRPALTLLGASSRSPGFASESGG